METKTKSIRLLTLALIATVMAFGSAAARATVISGSIQGCLLINVQAGQDIEASCLASGNSGNLFGANKTALLGDPTEFSLTQGKWIITADVDADGSTSLTVKNTSAVGANPLKTIQNVHLLISGLAFDDGDLDGFQPGATLKSTDPTGSIDQLADLINLPVTMGVNANGTWYQGDWYDIAFNNSAMFLAQEEITVSAKLKTVPEPGSLALLGAVLLAIGLASIKRVRLFGVRSTGLAS